jgi:hypothetical protein
MIARFGSVFAWFALPALVLAVLGLAACSSDPASYADPTAAPPQDLSLTVLSPVLRSSVAEPTVALEVSVLTPHPEPLVVEARVDEAGFDWEPLQADGDRFALALGSRPGDNRVLIRARQGARSFVASHEWIYAGDSPGLRLKSPRANAAAMSQGLVVSGDVWQSEEGPPVAVTVQVDALPAIAAPLGTNGQFSLVLDLPVNTELSSVITATARDAAGREASMTRAVRRDAAGPQITVFEPLPNDVISEVDAPVLVRGGAVDDVELVGAWAGAPGSELEPLDGVVTFEGTVMLPAEARGVEVVVEDAAGRRSVSFVPLRRARAVRLEAPTAVPSSAIELELGAADLASLVDPAGAADIVLLCLDMRLVIAQILAALGDPEAYGMNTQDFDPLARNMLALLQMTPDSARFEGTALQPVMDLALALGMPPSKLLSELLQIAPTDTFLPTPVLVDVLMERLVATHPALQGAPPCTPGALPVSLADALTDMATLENTLGPAAPHPGLVAGQPAGKVLTGTTRMRLTAASQLVRHAGVDLQSGKAWVHAPPSGAAVLTFDFQDGFALDGLPDFPLVDLDFQLFQAPGVLPGGAEKGDSPPDFPRGTSKAWELAEPWLLEGVVIDAAYRAYSRAWAEADHAATLHYALGDLDPAATLDWDKGWLEITTASGVGSPPAPSYLWDTLLDVAQVRLTDDGAQDPASAPIRLPLRNIPMPVTASQVQQETPGLLNQQAHRLSEVIAGLGPDAASPVDWVLLSVDGALFLDSGARLAPDRDPGAATALFEDAALSAPVPLPFAPSAGRVVYCRDEDGALWALQFTGVGAAAVDLVLSPVAEVDP